MPDQMNWQGIWQGMSASAVMSVFDFVAAASWV
jgi:hypothetical protein